MEENITTIEELKATIAALNAENESLKAEAESLRKAAEKTKKDYELYREWYGETANERDRIKGCLKAIAVLIDAIGGISAH